MARLVLIAAAVFFISACNLNQISGDVPPASPKADAEMDNNPALPNYRGGFTREQRISDANMIIGIMERKYAPRAWKEEFLGVNFAEMSREFLRRAGGDISDLEFYEVIGRYFSSFHDTHTSASFPTTYRSNLPFDVDDIGGRVVVVRVADDWKDRGIRTGDELVSLCGVPVEQAMEELRPLIGEGNPETERHMAALFLTWRPQTRFPSIPTGQCTVEMRSMADGSVRQFEMEWQTTGFPLAELNDPGVSLESSWRAQSANEDKNILDKARNPSGDADYLGLQYDMSVQAPAFELWDNFVQRSATPYLSGVGVVGTRRIGFMRIHTFSLESIRKEDAISELETELGFFEGNTDALVLDLTGNPGGSVCHAFDLASFFISEPRQELMRLWRANREHLNGFERVVNRRETTDADRAIALNITNGMRGALQRGDLLTEPYPMCKINGTISPYQTGSGARISYTKPVILLVDELSASAAEHFAAVMQDAERAVVFGTTTAGAGGSVIDIEQGIGYSEITIRYTVTLAVREREVDLFNGVRTRFIENVGVRPDVEFAPTVDDYLNGYRAYRQAFELTVLNMIPR